MKMSRCIRLAAAAASGLLAAIMRVAKRWAAPGAGPKLVTG
jgi:hypothetical protein